MNLISTLKQQNGSQKLKPCIIFFVLTQLYTILVYIQYREPLLQNNWFYPKWLTHFLRGHYVKILQGYQSYKDS